MVRLLLFVLLPAVICLLHTPGSGAREHCGTASEMYPSIYEYSQFEKEVVTPAIQQKLLDVFYPPNEQSPYSVVVRYQTVLTNGTSIIVSTDPTCNSQLWSWNSVHTFQLAKPSNANRYSLYLLNNFKCLEIPHLDITVPYLHPNITFDFLLRLTSSLKNYARPTSYKDKEWIEHYVEMGCGTHEHTTMFHKPYKGTQQHSEEYVWYAVVNSILLISPIIVLVTICTAKENFKLKSAEILKGTVERTFWKYGVLWGIATTAIGVHGVMLYLYITIAVEVLPSYAQSTIFAYFTVFILLMLSPLISFASSIYILLRSSVMDIEVAIPYIFLLPARAVFCCRNKQHAKKLVLFLLIYVLLWNALQFSIQGLILLFTATASPHIVGLCVIVLFCLLTITNFLGLIFTVSAYYCTSRNQRPEGQKTTMCHALIEFLIPGFITLFLSIFFFCTNISLIAKITTFILGIVVEMIVKYIPHILTKQTIKG